MKTRLRISCVFLWILYLQFSEGIVIETYLKCCDHGVKHAMKNFSCNHTTSSLSINPIWHGLCMSASSLCCTHHLENEYCASGRGAARGKMNCDEVKFVENESSIFRDCCKSCQIGLAVATENGSCSDGQIIGSLSKFAAESFSICCNGSDEEIIISEDDNLCLLAELENKKLCQQICEPTADSYICNCKPGFSLDSNNITCTKIEFEYDSVEIDDENDELVTCKDGFALNSQDECEDVDECRTGMNECNDNQYCMNTIGSYKCLAIRKTDCREGFRFNADSEECDDINECHEKIHECRSGQICKNIPGNYTCIDNEIPKCGLKQIYNTVTLKCEDEPKDSGMTDEGCKPGFYMKHNKCLDIDECKEKDACEYGAICVNEMGGYKCNCKTGFKKDSRDECVDINECQVNNHNCLSTQKCENTIGSYTCVRSGCEKGYIWNTDKSDCEDKNECQLGTHNCPEDSSCSNIPGSFKCDCKLGFKHDKILNKCVDINECSMHIHNCLPTQRCDNTIGSYTCVRMQSCGTGYVWNAETRECDDDDECELGSHNCPAGYYCHNLIGSFRCFLKTTTSTSTTPTTTTTTTTIQPFYADRRLLAQPCPLGFKRSHLGACVDIDECLSRDICPKHHTCTNSNGSYKCEDLNRCPQGFRHTNRGDCVDIDECQERRHNCQAEQICENYRGSYKCICKSGYRLSPSGSCIDIDECKSNVCPQSAICRNTQGSYSCECLEGFMKHNNNCLDIDECKEYGSHNLCEHDCVNYYGTYRCKCNMGYVLGKDNRTCDDINECEVHKNFHLCMGECLNVPGSYRCSCPRGYKLDVDKRSCKDINECQQNICTGRYEVCTNTAGGYKCHNIKCPPGYYNDPKKTSTCHILNNRCEGYDCIDRMHTISHSFVSMYAKQNVPPNGRSFFNLRGPSRDELRFDLKVARVMAMPGVRSASEEDFQLLANTHDATLMLMSQLEGMQDIELHLTMSVYNDGELVGKSVAKVFIYVSQYAF